MAHSDFDIWYDKLVQLGELFGINVGEKKGWCKEYNSGNPPGFVFWEEWGNDIGHKVNYKITADSADDESYLEIISSVLLIDVFCKGKRSCFHVFDDGALSVWKDKNRVYLQYQNRQESVEITSGFMTNDRDCFVYITNIYFALLELADTRDYDVVD